ncbi:MAG: mechanosensitive ion channel family protein, partial [Polyangiaceae bacterium]|nr:mechanosensitive ion channel family protein [Polyangiaceae bacterium]
PRAAVMSWLGAPVAEDAPRVMPCLDFEGAGIRPSRHAELAHKLKQVFDARGLWVDVDALPDSAEVEGNHVWVHRGLPEIWLTSKDGAWVVSAESVSQIDALHAETFQLDLRRYVDQLPAFMRDTSILGVAPWQVTGLAAIVLLALFARWLTTKIISVRVAAMLARRGDRAEGSTLAKAADPIGAMLAAFLVYHFLPALELGVRVNQTIVVALRLIATTAGVLVVYRLVDVMSEVLAARAAKTESVLDDQLVPLVRKSVKVIVACVGVIFVLQNLDVDVGSLLAGASLGGLAFTLAARDTVANLFGSVSIFTDRPFQVGDWVVIDGKEGTVLEVGMRSTRIRTSYESVISIPNSVVAVASVDNYGTRTYRRQSFTLDIPYGTPPERVQAFVDGIRAILRSNPKIREEIREVHFRNFGASALEVFVCFFFRVGSWSEELTQRHSVLLDIMRLADDVGVSFAFPTQTLHIESLAAAAPPAPRPERKLEELTAAVHALGSGRDRG